MAINKVILSGRLTKDPEERKAGDYKVASFTVAVDRNYGKDKTADFFDCTAWQKQAEFMLNYLAKGSYVIIEGRLKQDTWEKDGKKQSKVSVIVDRVESPSDPKKVKDENLDGGEISLDSLPF